MKKTTTNNDDQTLRYVYGETTSQENGEIELLALIQTKFYEEIEDFKTVKRLINEVSICPRITTLKNILAYSKI